MIELPRTEQLLQINGIDQAQFDEKLYQTLLLGVFEALCKDIRKNDAWVVERERYRRYTNKTVAAKIIVSNYVGCILPDEAYVRMADLLSAFFSTGDSRKQFDLGYREKLVNSQGKKCAICKKDISVSNSHLDHIVPWDYVGDCLKENYQMLCETCNTRKGKSTSFELSMMLLNRGDSDRR